MKVHRNMVNKKIPLQMQVMKKMKMMMKKKNQIAKNL